MAAAKLCSQCGRENRQEAVFCDQCGTRLLSGAVLRFGSPESYTPKHLVERILAPGTVLEGERKQVTVFLRVDLRRLETCVSAQPAHLLEVVMLVTFPRCR